MWKKIKGGSDESAKIMHTQKFFRMLLSQYSDDTSNYYYSLCEKDVVHDDYNWHCITCQKCERWNYWHCGTCDECEFMNKIFTFYFSNVHTLVARQKCSRKRRILEAFDFETPFILTSPYSS